MRAFLTFLAGFCGFIVAAIMVGGGFYLRDYFDCPANDVTIKETVVHESRPAQTPAEYLNTGAPGATSVAPQRMVSTEMVTYDSRPTIASDWKIIDPYAGVAGTYAIHPDAPLPDLIGHRETLPDGSKIVVFRAAAHQEQVPVGIYGKKNEEGNEAGTPEEPADQAPPKSDPVAPAAASTKPAPQPVVQATPPV